MPTEINKADDWRRETVVAPFFESLSNSQSSSLQHTPDSSSSSQLQYQIPRAKYRDMFYLSDNLDGGSSVDGELFMAPVEQVDAERLS